MTDFYTTIAANQVRDYVPAVPLMVTATSYYGYGQRRSKARRADGSIPPVTRLEHVPEVAADSGGFAAATVHGGRYPFSFEAYVAWLETIPNLTWAALPDLPVERELAATFEDVRARQELTLQWARELWGEATEHEPVTWCWVPTIQGREVADYLWMAEQLGELLTDQLLAYDYTAYAYDRFDGDMSLDALSEAEHGAEYRRVGIGSLCHLRSTAKVVAIVRAVADALPGVPLHLWGVKLDAIPALREAGLLDRIVSLDSAAWNKRVGGRALEQARAEQRARGLSQAEHSWLVAHPSYVARVAAELATAPPAGHQQPLFAA